VPVGTEPGDKHITKATEHSVERRNTIRYRVNAQTFFRWKRSRSNRFQGEGTTRDISLTGVYILTATCPPVDSIIHVDVIIPRLFNVCKRELKAEMRVLRVEDEIASQGRSGFSAVCNCFLLGATPKQLSDPASDFAEKLGGEK
jgi:PilZ domain